MFFSYIFKTGATKSNSMGKGKIQCIATEKEFCVHLNDIINIEKRKHSFRQLIRTDWYECQSQVY